MSSSDVSYVSSSESEAAETEVESSSNSSEHEHETSDDEPGDAYANNLKITTISV